MRLMSTVFLLQHCFIALLIIDVNNSAFAGTDEKCSNLDKRSLTDRGLDPVLGGWRSISSSYNLKNHNPSKYKYPVWATVTYRSEEEVVYLAENFHSIDREGKPKKQIHLSLVSEDNNNTFYGIRYGMIVKVPYENIEITSDVDIGVVKALKLHSFDTKIREPDVILSRTGPGDEKISSWNDIQIKPTSEYGRAEVAGFFIKPDEDGEFTPWVGNKKSKAYLTMASKTMGLPLIELNK